MEAGELRAWKSTALGLGAYKATRGGKGNVVCWEREWIPDDVEVMPKEKLRESVREDTDVC